MKPHSRVQMCREFAADHLRKARRAKREAQEDYEMFESDPTFGLNRVMYHMKQYAKWKTRATALDNWHDGYDTGFDRGWGGASS